MEKPKMSLIIGICIVIVLVSVAFGVLALSFNSAKNADEKQENDKTPEVVEKVDEEVKNTENTEKDDITKNEEKAETKTEIKVEEKTETKTETKSETKVEEKNETSSEIKKEETTDSKTSEEIIEEAREWMKKIAEALRNQVTAAFDGKTVSGAEVIAACQQYENSEQISVKIYVSRDKSFQTGKYAVKLAENIPTEPKIGGIEVEPTGSIYEELGRNTTNLKKDSLSDINSEGGVSGTQTYYSYTMKDKSTGTVIGVLFVKKGI